MRKLLLCFLIATISIPLIAQIGRVGINTTTPAAMLHVKDSSVVFTGVQTFPPGNPPVTGAGVRMMWLPDQAAFRAGSVIGAGAGKWNRDSIGAVSVAIGLNTKASGTASIALGYESNAIDQGSIALGMFNNAAMDFGTAIGYYNNALNTFTTAIGTGTTSIGYGSTAIGYNSMSTGMYARTLGTETRSRSFASFSTGIYNDSMISSSPNSWVPSDPLFIIGNGTSISSRSNAFIVLKNARTGINTSFPQAMLHVKDSSVVFTGSQGLPPSPGNPPIGGAGIRMMWYPNKAAFRVGEVTNTFWDKDSIGLYSFASGVNSKAKGYGSTAMGVSSEAVGNYSTAIGQFNFSPGSAAVSLGFLAQAWGDASFSAGFSTIAIGDNAIAMGVNSIADGMNSFAAGSSTRSLGTEAFSMGLSSIAYGDQSIALNNNSHAIAAASIASGINTYSTGIASFSAGINTYSKPYASVAIGQYNDSVISSSNTSWIATDPVFIIGNGTASNARSNALTILKNAKMGIATSSPQAMLHIKESIVPTAQYNPNTVAIFEGSANAAFIQLSHPTTVQSGILSGTSVTDIRSAIIFRADSSMQFRTGGNTTRMAIDKTGNVGIGITSPSEKLEVNGNAIISGNEMVTGNSTVDGISTVTGEIRRTSTGTANMVPVCYGSIANPATISSGTSNISSVVHIATGVYEITISAETYTNIGYTTNVTAISNSAIIASTAQSAGKLRINTFNAAGVAIDTDSHFTVYKQ